MIIKGLSVKQPWAGLIVSGKKTIETRTRRTHYRGQVLICASKKPVMEGLPFGQAVAIVTIIDCVKMEKQHQVAACCPWSDDLWSWVLDDVVPIEPFPIKGALNLFTIPPEIIEARLGAWV